MPTNELPIPIELILKRSHLPCKLAELSFVNKEVAIQLLRAWGGGTKPITYLWNDALNALAHSTESESYLISSVKNYNAPKTLQEYPFPIDWELVHMMAYLPVKLAELSYRDQEAAIDYLRDWGEKKKEVPQLWDEVTEALAK